MTKAAQLPADDFIRASFDRLEPHRNKGTGNGVPGHAHVRQIEIVDHVLRGKLQDYRAIHRNMKLAEGDDIVLARGIVGIQTERI